MKAKRISDFLESGDGIGHLMSQAALLLRVRQVAKDTLPENLQRSCEIANIKQGKIVIFAENNAIAAKLRLYGPGLIENLTQRGWNLTAIKVEVQVTTPHDGSTPKQAWLSSGAGEALEALERELPESELKDRIRSLSQKVRR